MTTTLEIHSLWSTLSSRLNCDITGFPKTGKFGGFVRGRISSQCEKSNVRKQILAILNKAESGVRTKEIGVYLEKALFNDDRELATVQSVVIAFVSETCGVLKTKDPIQLSTLIFTGQDELRRMVEFVDERFDKLAEISLRLDAAKAADKPKLKTEFKNAIRAFSLGTVAIDVNLFGRMMAEHPADAIESACQFAHSLSTNVLDPELDDFNAVDHLRDQEEHRGAGHMGVRGFNSSCYYRYAAINYDALVRNLKGDHALARQAVEAFVRATVFTVPSGSQNNFATFEKPSTVLIVGRNGNGRMTLASAFSKPIQPNHKGTLEQRSAEALDAYWKTVTAGYGTDGIIDHVLFDISGADFKCLNGEDDGNRQETFDAAVKVAMSWIPQEEK